MHQAIILAGGTGTRLRSVVADRPKPLAIVAGRPFLDWLILSLRAHGVRDIVLSTGYQGGLIERTFSDGSALGVRLRYSHETQPLGTAGAIRLALSLIDGDTFFVLNGDSYCRMDFGALALAHKQQQARATLCLTQVDDCARYGAVELDANNRITAFAEKGAKMGAGWINAGVYALGRAVIEPLALNQPASIERDVFPALTGAGLFGFAAQPPFLDIGTPESYHASEAELRAELWAVRTRAHLLDSAEALTAAARDCGGSLSEAAQLLSESFRSGGKLLICGNGGSAADAQHLAAEFVSRLTADFARPAMAAIALTTDTSFITAYANDIDFDGIFERQVQALGNPGDVLLCLSTSGNSRNCLRAVNAARERGMRTIAITGPNGTLQTQVDCPVVVTANSTQLVQECSLALYHVLVDLVERALHGATVAQAALSTESTS